MLFRSKGISRTPEEDEVFSGFGMVSGTVNSVLANFGSSHYLHLSQALLEAGYLPGFLIRVIIVVCERILTRCASFVSSLEDLLEA